VLIHSFYYLPYFATKSISVLKLIFNLAILIFVFFVCPQVVGKKFLGLKWTDDGEPENELILNEMSASGEETSL